MFDKRHDRKVGEVPSEMAQVSVFRIRQWQNDRGGYEYEKRLVTREKLEEIKTLWRSNDGFSYRGPYEVDEADLDPDEPGFMKDTKTYCTAGELGELNSDTEGATLYVHSRSPEPGKLGRLVKRAMEVLASDRPCSVEIQLRQKCWLNSDQIRLLFADKHG